MCGSRSIGGQLTSVHFAGRPDQVPDDSQILFNDH